jgi:hypothetical protein
MRFPNRWLAGSAGMLVVGLVGCSSSAPAPVPYSGSAAPSAISSATASAPAESAVPQTGPPEPETKDGALAAAARFYGLYSADQFSAAWGLLSPTARLAVPRALWISVHSGCPSAGAGTTRVIKSVLVFGNAAIVTETIAGVSSRLGEAEDVFNYANDRWGYAPDDLSIYHHGSVGADIAAAKALGFCSGEKATPL